jgi:quercetin dioxygenase-like cupin family protein
MEIKPSKVNKIIDLIEYQDGSVVSRMLINKDSGSITLFAFDKEQKLSEHTAPFDAFAHILDGKAEIIISGKKFVLTQGDMIIMPANKPHAVKAVERFKMLLTMISDKDDQ